MPRINAPQLALTDLPVGRCGATPSVAVFLQWQRLGGVILLAAAASGESLAQTFSEGFDDVASLTENGWVILNNSSPNPADSTSVFQGNFNGGINQPPPVFSSHVGDRDSYAAMNYNSTASGGTISTWLISPELEFRNGDLFSFFSRTVSNPQFADRLEVRMSYAGASFNVGDSEFSVGDFTTLLLTINEGLTPAGYPSEWTEFGGSVDGLNGPASGRLAFRYFVPNGGASGVNSDYIGIDSLSFNARLIPAPVVAAEVGVPEASPLGAALAAAGALAWQGRRLLRKAAGRN